MLWSLQSRLVAASPLHLCGLSHMVDIHGPKAYLDREGKPAGFVTFRRERDGRCLVLRG